MAINRAAMNRRLQRIGIAIMVGSVLLGGVAGFLLRGVL